MKRTVTTPTFSQILKEAIRSELLELKVSMPAKIETYDESNQKASVLPLLKIRLKNSENTELTLPIINNVPVRWDCADSGNAFISLPLKKGDIGMIHFCDRSIDKYLSISSSGEITPVFHDNYRHHDINDAWFIPGPLPFARALQEVSADDIIIKNNDLKIEISPNGTISIKNSDSNDLIDLIHETLTFIKDAKVLTMMGPQGFTAADILKIEQNLTKIESFKK